ncbi:hypothetical protein PGIGA_G00021880 [Pangasianodon gigas]|uniref:Uncharacterized protein n=1 Tax=Pangasianodon gigas TaxID=30993 RepID=A0ACC5WVI9_PANGG|nr:hypothetical protein [Pangasianodon gigas]
MVPKIRDQGSDLAAVDNVDPDSFRNTTTELSFQYHWATWRSGGCSHVHVPHHHVAPVCFLVRLTRSVS